MRIFALVVMLLLLGCASTVAAQTVGVSHIGTTATDTTAMPKGLELLQPGALVRASFSPCGDPQRGTTQLTGTFLELQPGAFQVASVGSIRLQRR